MQPAPVLSSIAAACWQVTIRDWTRLVRVRLCGQAVLGNLPRNGFMAFGYSASVLTAILSTRRLYTEYPCLRSFTIGRTPYFSVEPRD
jgi:hypothetical protein